MATRDELRGAQGNEGGPQHDHWVRQKSVMGFEMKATACIKHAIGGASCVVARAVSVSAYQHFSRRLILRTIVIGLCSFATLVTLAIGGPGALAQDQRKPETLPQRVTFPGADGKTELVGYVFRPVAATRARLPAVVMMHGRAGPYSSLAKGVYDASTLSLRHQAWGRIWSDNGYLAVLVDGFGPRGYPQGFARFSYASRPTELDEVTVRPLDAYATLAYLRRRVDVIADRIGLQGWSNGGSAAIATMDAQAPGIAAPTPATGFRAALMFYPACGLKGQFDNRTFRPYARVRLFHGSADEEVSHMRCTALVDQSRANGGDVEIKIYAGATHSFDSPARSREKVDANATATKGSIEASLQFFARHIKGK